MRSYGARSCQNVLEGDGVGAGKLSQGYKKKSFLGCCWEIKVRKRILNLFKVLFRVKFRMLPRPPVFCVSLEGQEEGQEV